MNTDRPSRGATRRGLSRTVACASLVLAALTGLAACGGGYGGSGSSAPPPPTVSLSVTPTTITLGQTATLSWNASAGSTCTAGGAWSGAEAASGTLVVTPTATGAQTYTLSCVGGGAYAGSAAGNAVLTVNAPTAFVVTTLATDTTAGLVRDANLVNGWGLAFGPHTPAWVANNGSGTSTVYDGNGRPQPASGPRVVTLPPIAASRDFAPTGVVFNTLTGFAVGNGGQPAPANFIFAGEGGAIAGWAAAVDPRTAIVAYAATDGAVYKGLALASDGAAGFLYATDFRNGKIDVLDSAFHRQATSAASFAFTDPQLPAGYAPFGIQAFANGTGGASQLYVTYAKKATPEATDDVAGDGFGLIDVYDAHGAFVKRLVSPGAHLNAPWGLAVAPADFGSASGTLLVANFGDGRINAYSQSDGTWQGALADGNGRALALDGLWAIAFGNDANNAPHNALFYTAGPNAERDGTFGRIDAGSPPVLNAAPVVTVTAPSAGPVHGIVAVTATVSSPLAITSVEFFANGAQSIGSATGPYTVQWDTTHVADGPVTLTAVATDADGNRGTSHEVAVTIANHAPPPAPTLAQLQDLIFTPKCSGCHNGSNTALPGVQDLRAGHAFASVVGVASIEQPSLLRVKPGDPGHSYLVQKIEGAAGIGGSRMPLGGPPLSQDEIDRIRARVSAGAANN